MRLPALLVVLSANLVAQATWSQLYPVTAPGYRFEAATAFYEPSASMVVFSGTGPAGRWNDAWLLQGSTWTPMAGALPPARAAAAMVYDSLRQRLVLFGGSGASGKLQDTWEWSGTTWSTSALTTMPSARSGHAMAFDPIRGVTVLYGGTTNGPVGSNIVGDLWEWNGIAWSQRAQTGGPGARTNVVLAFDPARQQVMLHGGSKPLGTAGSTVQANDTWNWDGTTWQQRFPSTPPQFRSGAGVASDVHRRRVVMQGGSGPGADGFAWEWDGSEWHLLLMASPASRSEHAMVYDSVNRRTLLYGGSDGWWIDDTWKFETPTPASVIPFGSACAGSAGTPQLAPAPYELPWLGDTIHHRVTNVPPTEPGAVFLTGFTPVAPASLAPIGMVGCTLLVSIDWATFAPNVAGAAEWTLAVPVSASLVGASIQQQAFPLDAAANPFGLSASNALTATFGVR